MSLLVQEKVGFKPEIRVPHEEPQPPWRTPGVQLRPRDILEHVRRESDALLRLRARSGITAFFSLLALYMLGDVLGSAAGEFPLHLIRVLQTTVLVFGFVELGRPCSTDRAIATAFVVAATACAIVSAEAMELGGLRTVTVTTIVVSLATAAFFPWGAVVQTAVVAVACGALLMSAHALTGQWIEPLGTSTMATVVMAFGASIYTAYELERWRIEKAREALERERAQDALQSLNIELEQRVKHRTAQLRATMAELETFSYSVSHDLRAPLRAIDGFSQALAEDLGERMGEDAHTYIAHLRGGVTRMNDIINSLLLLGRVTRADLKHEDVDLSEIAEDVARELSAGQPERQMTWKIADGLHAHGDAKLLHQVLQNLIGNAWKFTQTSDNPQVVFGSVQHGTDIAYFVADNGIGFDMETSSQLFEPFKRLPEARDFDGTGVGLATVRRIIDRHSGRVWAKGKPDQGATVFFTIGESVLGPPSLRDVPPASSS